MFAPTVDSQWKGTTTAPCVFATRASLLRGTEERTRVTLWRALRERRPLRDAGDGARAGRLAEQRIPTRSMGLGVSNSIGWLGASSFATANRLRRPGARRLEGLL